MPQKKKQNKERTPEKKQPDTVVFTFEKSPNYSVYAISGAHGGLTPRGEFLMDVYFERHAMPSSITHEVQDDGKVGAIIQEDQKNEITREVLFGLSMHPQTAVSLRDWLNDIILKFESIGILR